MRTYCPGDTVNLQLLGCWADDLLDVKLVRPSEAAVLMANYTLDVDGYDVKLPDTVCSGVWKLLARTRCGCNTALINIACGKLQFVGETTVTNLRPVTKVCCEDETT